MKILLSFLIFAGLVQITLAQPQDNSQWTLEQCITYAQEHNLTLKQQALNVDRAKNQLELKKLDLLPNLNANSSYTTRMGRVRNDFDYEISDITTRFSDVNVSSTTPVFEGFAKRKSIEKGRIDWQAALKDVEKAENDLALNITALFIQILFDQELLQSAQQQLEVTNLQMKRTGILVQNDKLPQGSLLEMNSMVARELMNVTSLENNLTMSLLDLAQALDLEEVIDFNIQKPDLPEYTAMESLQDDYIYQIAVNTLPQIAASEMRLESGQKDVEIARGYLWPRLSFSAGWGTSVSKFRNEPNFDFTRRFEDNAFRYYGLNLSIPIFNGLTTRKSVTSAKIGSLNARYELEKQKLMLRKEIQQAQADAVAALRQYRAGAAAVESYQESFSYTEKRFNLGLVNSVDYNVAKTDYSKAESDFIQARYTYFLRKKILDFYQGKPLVE
ncbi:MAG TPA: TolC family protein [Marinilabiliaceae bacterium]|nr:TolC family protein [Marinilabiliaceae bacterium]